MTTPSPSKDSGHARRVIVTLVIATATAAVTAGVVLQKHPRAEAVVEAPPALSQSAPTSIAAPLDSVAAPSDRSLPAAADALQRATDASGEPTPTF
jgi:hypothetical protein